MAQKKLQWLGPERRKVIREQRSQRLISGYGIGVPLAILLSWIISINGVTVPPEVSAAFGAVIGVAVMCIHEMVSAVGKVAFTVLKRKLGVR